MIYNGSEMSAALLIVMKLHKHHHQTALSRTRLLTPVSSCSKQPVLDKLAFNYLHTLLSKHQSADEPSNQQGAARVEDLAA